jgi:hypothetical protein
MEDILSRLFDQHPKTNDPKKPSFTIQEACTAFELQVPVNQRKVMEDILSRLFDQHPETNQLKFVYYKQRHSHPSAFVKAVQLQ